MSWNLRCSGALGCAAKERGKELVCSLMQELLGDYSDPCYKSELPLSTFLWPDNIKMLVFPLLLSAQGRGAVGGTGLCEHFLGGAVVSKG